MKRALITFFVTLGLAAAMGAGVELSWVPVNDPSVVGYNVYVGLASHSYDEMIPSGTNTSLRIDGLEPGATYYFAVTSVDSNGVESDFSPEWVDEIPVPQPTNIVTVFVPLLSSTNLTTWTTEQVYSVSFTNPPGQKFFRFGLAITQTNN